MTYDVAAPIPRLTAYRGYAALAILGYHLVLAFELGDGALRRAELFKIAVTFFFVLSGFVLTHAGRFDSIGEFWQARAARILPLYVLAWLMALAARSWLHWIPSQTELLASLMLVQAWVPDPDLAMSVNPVGWSLSCEVACYLALPLLAPLLLRLATPRLKLVTWLTIAWLALGALLSQVAPVEWWVGYRGGEFVAGVLLAVWLRRGWLPRASFVRLAALGGTLVLVSVAAGLPVPVPMASFAAMPAFVLFIATAAVRRADVPSSLLGLGGQYVGRWSYSLYLTHWVVVVLVSRFGSELWRVVLAAVVSIALAAVLSESIERPAQRRLARRPSAAERPPSGQITSAAATKDADLKAF
jgi:peptidoglycan/LPS O-acetylase OafA/YrhL